MDDLVQPLLAFVTAHKHWAVAVMFVTAFGESFAFIGLMFPGTALLIAAGTLVAHGALPRWPLIAGAVAGAVLGDQVSYWLGRRYGGGIARLWPFNRNPDLLPKGIRFFALYGGISVFVGRFFGPLRAVIPLAAGILRMPPGAFRIANIASALVWAPMLLFVGDVVGRLGTRLIGESNTIVATFVGLIVIGLAGAAWAMLRHRRPKSGR